MDAEPSPSSARVEVHRLAERGRYDRATIDRILDDALVAHLGFAVDGQPYVIPAIHARDGDEVYVHGSVASRLLRMLGRGAPACLTVTLVDGLVVARSAFHSSLNYRSVVLLGVPRAVRDPAEHRRALDAITDHVLPGRRADLREPHAHELRQTAVIAFRIDEASAKIRTGDPHDDDADLDLPIWAGVVPVTLVAGEPRPAADLRGDVAPPPYLPRGPLGAPPP